MHITWCPQFLNKQANKQANKMLFIQSSYFINHDKEDNMCRKKTNGHRYMSNMWSFNYHFNGLFTDKNVMVNFDNN